MAAYPYLRVAALIVLARVAHAQYTISTLAGNGPGNGAIATAFAIGQPGIAFDNSKGVLYVSSASCSCIYSVSNQSQFARMVVGNGSRGVAANGPAATALLSSPAGLAVDSTGRLYIADLFNNVIRRVDFQAGTITTVAGTGTQGFANGAAILAAELNQPQAVAVDGNGNIYIADTGNNAIREVLASSNTMITIAQGLAAPAGVAVDGMGNVYIADTGNHKVVNAALTTIAGTGTAGYNGDSNTVPGLVATTADLYHPQGIMVDPTSQYLYIGDTYNNRVRKVALSTGNIVTVAGNGNYADTPGLSATAASLENPNGLALDSSGNLYIAEFARVDLVSGTTQEIEDWAGNGSFGSSGDGGTALLSQIFQPAGVAIDNNNGLLYIADTYNDRIRMIDLQALPPTITTVAGNGTQGYTAFAMSATQAPLNLPSGVAVDSHGNLYIADTFNQTIEKVTMMSRGIPGSMMTIAGFNNVGIGFNGGYNGTGMPPLGTELSYPWSIAFDSSDNLYIADTSNNLIREIASGSAIMTTLAGQAPNGGPLFGAFAQPPNGFLNPSGVAVGPPPGNPSGTPVLYVADTFNGLIRTVTLPPAAVTITTIAGGGSVSPGDGQPPLDATLGNPYSIAVDNLGDYYVAENNGWQAIRKVGGNTIATIAGNGTPGYGGDGLSANDPLVYLNRPFAVAFNSVNNHLYIADYNNQRIRELTPVATTITSLSPSSTPVGSALAGPLVVTGQNFVDGDKVIWQPAGSGAIPLTTTFVNETELKATVAPSQLMSAGTVDVFVNVLGSMITAPPFTITPALIITSPANGSSSPNGTVTVTATGVMAGDTVTIQLDNAAPQTFSATSGTFSTSIPAGVGSHTLTVTDVQSGATATVSFTITQLVIGTPAANATVFAGAVVITASGATPNSTATIGVTGTSTLTHVQTGGSGAIGTSIALVPGTYTLTITDASGAAASVNFTVVPVEFSVPPVNESITVSDTPAVVAFTPPQQAYLATNSAYNIPLSLSGAGGLTVTMSGLPGMMYSNGSLTGTPAAAGTYTVTLTVQNAAGRTLLSTSFTVVVAVGVAITENIGVSDTLPTDTETILVTDTPTILPYFPSDTTAAGSGGIAVEPTDSTTQQQPLTVTFPTVTTAGITTLTTSTTGPAAPAGFTTGTPPTYYNLATTAAYSGTIAVCINVAGQSFQGSPSLWHYQSNAWVNITTSYNPATSMICGSVTSLSPFAVFQPAATPTAGLAFFPVTPCRVADTRNPNGPFGGPMMTAGGTRTFVIPSGACGIPVTAQAYALNVTVVPQSMLGYLTIWPAGSAKPYVSTLNSSNGAILANAAIVPAGAGGAVSVFVTDNTQVILDVNGYFAPPSAGGLAFYPVTPCRVADTRNANGPFGGPSLAAGGTRGFVAPSSACGIPTTAQAYSLNMTAVPPGPLEYLTVWPTGQTQPNVSTLNALQGQIAANAAIVPAGTNGAVSVFVSDPSNVVIDINGYFAPPGGTGALYFYPVTPCRIADTRSITGTFGGPALGAGSTRTFPIPSSSCGLPSMALAYSFNMTVAPPGSVLYLSTWPAGQAQPVVSTLNDLQGQIIANAAIVPAGTSGGISVFVSDATNLVIDINGYFAQ